MGEPLSIAAAFIGSASFVKDVLEVWDAVRASIEDERTTIALAYDLHLFSQQDLRDDVQLHLEIAQSTLRDPGLSDERKCRLARDFQKLYTALEDLPRAIESVLKENPVGTKPSFGMRHLRNALLPSRSHFHTASQQNLKAKIANFQSTLKQFQTLVMTIRVVSHPKEAMEFTSEEFALIGSCTDRAKDVGPISICQASYITPYWVERPETRQLDVIIETLPYSSGSENDARMNIRTLAAKLKPALPAENIPSFLGYRNNAPEKTIELIFERPSPEKPIHSLAQMYANRLPEPSLNIRLTLCRQLAVAVLQAHTLGLVHKHIRPENLLVAFTESELGAVTEATLFLCGWQHSRKISGVASRMAGESAPGIVLYQHPSRYSQGEKGVAKEEYKIYHDIYGLGVCMLEFLLWEALILPGRGLKALSELSNLYKQAYRKLGYDTADQSEDIHSAVDTPTVVIYTRDGDQVQSTLELLAKEQLPRKAGDRMTRLVCRCLGVSSNSERTMAGEISDLFESEILKELDIVSTSI